MSSPGPSELDWALGVVTDAAERGARFVLPEVLERGSAATTSEVRMALTVPTPAIGSVGAASAAPPSTTAMEAVTYLSCWAVGALLVRDHRRLAGDDPLVRSLQQVLPLLRRVLRPAA